MDPIRIILLGDIVGRPGRHACQARVASWRKELNLDMVIANGENASGGNGLTVKNAGELFDCGIDLITSGNHIWKQKDYPDLFETYPLVIRPANYPDHLPGKGWALYEIRPGLKVAVVNLLGQVFMDPIDSPFTMIDRIIDEIKEQTPIVLVDFHAEATSERVAMGHFLDGKVSGVVGTHTHVVTADERILPGGTAYQTDLGMVGPQDGVLGVDSEPILRKFTTGLPVRFEIAKGPVVCNGTVVTIDPETGNALDISRYSEVYDPEEKGSENEDR